MWQLEQNSKLKSGLHVLREWAVPVLCLLLLVALSIPKVGWIRSLKSGGAIVLVFVQAFALAHVALQCIRHRKFGFVETACIVSQLIYLSVLAFMGSFDWLWIQTVLVVALAVTFAIISLRHR